MIELAGLVLCEGVLRPGRVRVEGERIASVELHASAAAPAPRRIVAPGFVDLHVHGFGGCDPLADLAGMARALARAGTTSFQPTLFPRAPAALGEDCERLARATAALAPGAGARVLGAHLEGPFVHPRAAGALPRDDLAEPSPAALRAILGPATGDGRGVRTMTLAPELAGAADLVRELVRSGVRVSLGHTTAKVADARAAVKCGALGATHLYNAMSPLHHRDAGMVGVALASAIHAEIIGDLVHVGADALEIALAARGPGGLCLVSDALECAGTGCDRFHSRGRDHEVRDGAAFWVAEPGGEPRLAGSASSQLDMVRKLVARGVVTLEEALAMASTTPASALGRENDLGRIAPGTLADLVVLERADLSLARVLVAGREVALDAGSAAARASR